MDDIDFKLNVTAQLARIEEYTRPLPDKIEQHASRIARVENGLFRTTALASVIGGVVGFIVHAVAPVWSAVATIFRG